MKNGMKELYPGQWFTLNGHEWQYVKAELGNVTIRDEKIVVTYGLDAFRIIMRNNGYEVEVDP